MTAKNSPISGGFGRVAEDGGMTSRVAIAEFCKTGSGGTPSRKISEYFGGDIPWVKSGELRENVIIDTEEHISESALRDSSAKLVPAGAILVAMYGATVGRMAILGTDAATNQAVCNIIPNQSIADTKYVFHALQARVPHLLRQSVGGAQPNISQAIIKDTKIPLPPLHEQKRIAAILDKADAIRRKRRQALAMADQFLRAVFLEMFGDPVTNPKGWPIMQVESILSKKRHGTQSGPFGSALKKHEYVAEGVPVWNIDNVGPNQFDPTPILFITEDKYRQLERYSVINGDILISRAGTVGRMCVANPGVHHSIINTNLVRVSLDMSSVTPEYFVLLFTFCSHRLGGLKSNDKENAFTFLNPKTLKALRIPVPPMEIQRRFINCVRGIDNLVASRSTHQKEADHLFSSLTQRAFRGKL